MPGDVPPHVVVLPRERHAVEESVARRLSYVAFSVEELDQQGEDQEGALVALGPALLGAVVVVQAAVVV